MFTERKPAASDNGLQVIVLDFRACDRGCLRGFLSFRLSQLIVHDCRLFEKNGRRWVSLPDREYKKRDGTSGYAPIVELASREIAPVFQRAILAALDAHLEENRHVG